VGAVVAMTVALAGCGGGDTSPDVATAVGTDGPTASASSPGGLVAQYVAQRREFAKCLRDHGLAAPDPDARGQIDLSVAVGRNKTDPKVMKAMETCQKFLTIPVPEELEEKPPPLTGVDIERRREYAKCTRANGVPGFPDPGPDGQWPDRGPDGMTEQEAAASFRAQQICEPLLDGRPPTTPDPNATGRG
jgi:hypothetical protein